MSETFLYNWKPHLSITPPTFSLTKRQSVLTHTILQNGVPVLLDVSVTNTTSVKMSFPQKKKKEKKIVVLFS